MLVKRIKQQRGYSLIEMMVALVLSSVVMGGMLTIFFNSLKHSSSANDIGKLDQQLHSVMHLISSDVRRAGYWANAHTSNSNPFMVTGSTDITVNAGNNCVLLTYDADGDGSLPSIASGSDDERYGYRLINNIIQYRPWGADFNCSAADSAWQNLTDSNVIKITQFNVSKSENVIDLDGAGSGTAALRMRKLTITITGELNNDSSVSKTITRTVKIYNDKYTP